MKIGLLAYSTNTGLGYQTLQFFKHMKPEKTLIADLNMLNGVETHHERFPGARIDKCESYNLLSKESCEWLVDGMDVVFICETPLNHYIFEYAKSKGVKTVLQYNYEFLAYFRKPELPKPDILAAPTDWGIDAVKGRNWARVESLPVPIDTDEFEFRERKKVETFVHIIGRPAAHDRNGTITFLKAANMLKGFNFKVFLQQPREWRTINHFQPVKEALDQAKIAMGDRFELLTDIADNKKLYNSGEVLVLPRKYGGLCLPMWEALASGMPVLMPYIVPNDLILPKDWQFSARPEGEFQAHATVQIYESRSLNVADRMANIASSFDNQSLLAQNIAFEMSWRNQKKNYLNKLESWL